MASTSKRSHTGTAKTSKVVKAARGKVVKSTRIKKTKAKKTAAKKATRRPTTLSDAPVQVTFGDEVVEARLSELDRDAIVKLLATQASQGRKKRTQRAREQLAELYARILETADHYLADLEEHGSDLDEVGGVEQVADTLERLLPRPNRLVGRIGPIYTVGQLRRALPGLEQPMITEQAVRNRINDRRLVAFKTSDGHWAAPAFQFAARPGRLQVREDVIALWRELPLGGPIAAVDLVAWLRGPRRDLEGHTPLEWLDDHGLDEPLKRACGSVRRRVAA